MNEEKELQSLCTKTPHIVANRMIRDSLRGGDSFINFLIRHERYVDCKYSENGRYIIVSVRKRANTQIGVE